ncbi:MAG TPA: hypothetical protein VF271_08710 [Rhodanobacteraceae bacterium]
MLVLALFAGNLQAKDHHYADLYNWAQGVQWINSRPDGQYVHADIHVRSRKRDVPVSSIKLLIHAKTGDIVVPVSASGELYLPINGALITGNPTIEFTHRVGVSVEVVASAKPRLAFDYGLIRAMVGEYTRDVSHQDFLPDEFKYVHVRGLALAGLKSRSQVEADCDLNVGKHHGVIVIDYDKQVPAGCHVTLAQQPASMQLAFKWF